MVLPIPPGPTMVKQAAPAELFRQRCGMTASRPMMRVSKAGISLPGICQRGGTTNGLVLLAGSGRDEDITAARHIGDEPVARAVSP